MARLPTRVWTFVTLPCATAASTAMERAARLTPDPLLRGAWLAAATDDAYVAGDADRTRRLAAEVLGSDAEADPRARVLVALGTLEWSDGPFARARELFEQAAASPRAGCSCGPSASSSTPATSSATTAA